MGKIDTYRYILRIWLDRSDAFNASAVMLGFPCTRQGVIKVARAYCDSETENRNYGK